MAKVKINKPAKYIPREAKMEKRPKKLTMQQRIDALSEEVDILRDKNRRLEQFADEVSDTISNDFYKGASTFFRVARGQSSKTELIAKIAVLKDRSGQLYRLQDKYDELVRHLAGMEKEVKGIDAP